MSLGDIPPNAEAIIIAIIICVTSYACLVAVLNSIERAFQNQQEAETEEEDENESE